MRYFLYLGLLGLVACTKEPNVAVRIDCGDYNDKGLQATLNAQPVGDCPVDIMLHAGEVNVSVRKDNEDASYLFAEAKMTLAENAMKRIKLDVKPVFTERFYFLKVTDIQSAEEYLKRYPSGSYVNEIKKTLEGYYYAAINDLGSAKTYLNLYPKGQWHEDAESKLEGYDNSIKQKAALEEKIKNEKVDFLKSAIVKAMMSTIEDYPESKFYFKENSCDLVMHVPAQGDPRGGQMYYPIDKMDYAHYLRDGNYGNYVLEFKCKNSEQCLEDHYYGEVHKRSETSRLMKGYRTKESIESFVNKLSELKGFCSR